MNNIITAAELKDEIKFGLSGIYLFFGEEEYMKQYYLKEIRKKVLAGGEEAIFRHKKLSCAELDIEKIADALTTASLGFFSEGQTLVELHEIQFGALKEAEWKALLEIFSEASEDVITVIYAVDGDLDVGFLPKTPSKQLQRLTEYVKPVWFPREGDMKLAKWTAKHFIAEKLSYENGVCELMVAQCGRDMFVLANEIEKICAFVKMNNETVIKNEDVKRVCTRNLEINAFDFSNALLNFETDRALEIIADMKLRKEKPAYILSSVLKVITELYTVKVLVDSGRNDFEISKQLKLHEYKVKRYRESSAKRSIAKLKKLLEFCTETDIKLKSTSLDDYTELDKLVILSTAK
ncbi:MAG: DNA polymerase III subunit delta [Clostridia bacterium]|nr:DNA polymerase III subunit delta [Clostridia bacterium]